MADFMDFLTKYIFLVAAVALHVIIIENTIFTCALGTSTALFIIRKKRGVLVFGAILTFMTLFSSFIVIIINALFPYLSDYNIYSPFIFVFIISVAYLLVLLGLRFVPQKIKSRIIPMVHMSAFNCAVLGALLIGATRDMNPVEFIGLGLGMGIGFTLATFLISVSHDYLYSENIPKAFRGYPVTLVYIGILSLAFYGFIASELQF
ncbi:MAG: hypothetical protein FWG69_01470 [Oscillospiraceae bacterium]|nr:hypothetical protein [Oscillospiraceae bacterium]